MGATTLDGPEYVYGNLGNIEGGVLGLAGTTAGAVPDPNSDAGPSMFYQGDGLLDPRVLFLKDKVQGWTGMVPGFIAMDILESVRQIPSLHVVNNLFNAVGPTSGTPYALPTTSSLPAFACSVPVRTFSPVLNAGPVQTAALALDYGFGYATAPTIGTTSPWTPPAANIGDYFVGMPVCIVGQTASIAPLLTFITAVTATTFATALPNPGFTAAQVCAIGTGDLWGPNEASPASGGYPVPQAAAPFLASGPGLFFDGRQGVARGLVFTQVSGGSAGNVLISGADVWGSPKTQLLALPGGVATTYTTKTWKYIYSITPQFTDTSHTITIGTSDLFGFAFRVPLFEDCAIFMGSTWDAGPNSGVVPGVITNPATNLTGDEKGTFQSSAAGPLTGVGIWTGAVASSGSLTGAALSGNRLEMCQQISTAQAVQATQLNPWYLMGVTPV